MKRGKGHLKTKPTRLIKGRRNSEGWDKPKLSECLGCNKKVHADDLKDKVCSACRKKLYGELHAR